MAHHPAPFPFNEEERALSLEHLDVLDSAKEKAFDDIALLATTLCDAPIALVSLVDRDRQWFKACVGLGVQETHRDLAFCGHAILDPAQVLVIEDAALDPRFSSSPLVLGPPYIRFYAGAPIVTDSGLALGTVCVIDTQPRQLSERQSLALQALARQAAALLEARWLGKQREKQLAQLQDQFKQSGQNNSEVTPLLENARCISSLGMLTASIAHDFNNLLQSVSAAFQLTRLRSRRPIDVERFAETGLQAVEQGRQLISYLMSSVRGDGPELICIDVTARLHGAQSLMRHSMSEGIDLSFDFAEWGWGVLCMEAQLHAVLMNLLTNARDALKGAGQVHVSTGWVHVEDDLTLHQGDYLVVSVRDNGPGMPPDIAGRVFKPFFTTKATGQGTGLGLAQAKDFAVKSGGDARIETSPGAGTTVKLYLRILGCIATSEVG